MPDKLSGYYLRDFRLPHKGDLFQARLKFQGYAQFVINRSILSSDFGQAIFTSPETERLNYSGLIRTASLPEVKFKTDVKNQYNRKRIVSTGVDYSPVTIKLLDTAWNSAIDLILRYYAYNYMNIRNFSNVSRDDLKYIMSSEAENISSAFKTESFNSNLTGFNLNSSRYFFERIDYVLYSNQKGIQYSIFNPVLSEFRTGEIDYDANEVLEFDLTFDYENFTVFRDLNFDLNDFDKQRFENNDYANELQEFKFTNAFDPSMNTRPVNALKSNRAPQPAVPKSTTENAQNAMVPPAQIGSANTLFNLKPDISGVE